jgi:predicted metal-dependent hydrolase
MGAARHRSPRRLALGGDVLEVRVRESPRARRLRVTVAPGRPLEVVAPRGVWGPEIDRFLEQHSAWIEATRSRVGERSPVLGLDRPGVVWTGGEAVPVVRTSGRRACAELRGGRLVVAGGAEAVESWYRREARARLTAVLERAAGPLGVVYDGVSVRDQRTRWGSCSPRSLLSFSWRLVLAPAEVLAYVAVHELCHLREHNHSRAFWRLVESTWPSWRTEAAWLREYGYELHAYEPALALA